VSVWKYLGLIRQVQFKQAFFVYPFEVGYFLIVSGVYQRHPVNVRLEGAKKQTALPLVAAKVSLWVMAKTTVKEFAVKLIWVKCHGKPFPQ
jgi:hypothetical protein